MQHESGKLPRYDIDETYEWNYEHAPDPLEYPAADVPGNWGFCGLKVASPLGVSAGPLLNGRWVLYYASLGFDVLTYKTVRSRSRDCYPLPNLQPVLTGQLSGNEEELPTTEDSSNSWAVSFGMPSRAPSDWREDVSWTRSRLAANKVLCVSVVATEQPGWSIRQLAADYAQCARWAVESGADAVETNLSCPNVTTCDGQLFQKPEDAAIVAEAVRQAIGATPFVVKLGHVDDETLAVELIDRLHSFVDAFAMTNSVATRVRSESGLLFDGQKRGICGAATRTASLRQTRLFSSLIANSSKRIQLIGVGGVESPSHVREYLSAGASSVHLATAAMINPWIAMQIRDDLSQAL